MRIKTLIFAGAVGLAFHALPCAAQVAPKDDTSKADTSLSTGPQEPGRVGSLSPNEARRAARARQRAAGETEQGPNSSTAQKDDGATSARPRSRVAEHPQKAAPIRTVERSKRPTPSRVANRPQKPAPIRLAYRPQKAAPVRQAERQHTPAPVRVAEQPQRPTRVETADHLRPAKGYAVTPPAMVAHRPRQADERYAVADGDYPRRPPRPFWRFRAVYPMRYAFAESGPGYWRPPFRRYWRFNAGYPMRYPRVRYVIPYAAPVYVAPTQFAPTTYSGPTYYTYGAD